MPDTYESKNGGNIIEKSSEITINQNFITKTQNNRENISLPKALTTKIPVSSRSQIVGRKADLEDLHNRLFNNKQVVVVNGLGGIGKTTLAQVYAAQYWDEYHHIAWISQVSGNIIEDFINTEGFMDRLGIMSSGKDAQTLFNEILLHLERINTRPCLLIIDNGDAALSNWAGYLPRQPDWHILVTSREKIEHFDHKELGFLTENEAVELFLQHYTHKEITAEEIKKLVTFVDLHTLTIEILAKTAQKQHTSVNQLKNAMKEDLKAHVYINHNQTKTKIDKISSYLCSVFEMSHLNDNELWLMKQLACMPPEFHDYNTLYTLIEPAEYHREDSFSETLEELAGKGWLLYNKETGQYKMHRIITKVVQRLQTIQHSDVKLLIKNITSALQIDQTKDNPVQKFSWIHYGKALVEVFPDEEDAAISLLQNNLATVLQDLGDYKVAKALLQKAVTSAEKNFGPDHPNTAVCYSNLALVLKALGNYEGAKVLLEKAVTSDEKNFGPDHPNTAVSYSNLALVLKDLGDYEGAKVLLEKALTSDEKNFGHDHPNTARSYSNLALVLKNLGDFEGAKVLLEKAMTSAEKNFGWDHPTTAIRYSNLATVLKNLGDYEGAKVLLEKAMTSNEKNFGHDHPNTAIHYSNLATVLQDLADYEGAKLLLEKAMTSDEKNFGPDHPSTGRSYSNLALVLKDLGDYEGAKVLLEKAISSAEINFGPDHPNTAVSYSNLALVLQDLGDYEEAKVLLEKAMISDEKNFGRDHPSTAVSYSNLATVLKNLGDYEGALTLAEKALHIFKKVLPADHPYIRQVTSIYENIKKQVKDGKGNK